jgi:undecaprenyl pyrophosphate phosphatase UppP
MQWLIDILLGLVEGFTEFLPRSVSRSRSASGR